MTEPVIYPLRRPDDGHALLRWLLPSFMRRLKEEGMGEKLEVKRTERGWAGHFIDASRCRFRRNTLLECGEKRIVVSTIGALENGERVGYNSYYETMAFPAKKKGIYWEANTDARYIPFARKWFISTLSETTDAEANDMHEAVVAEITEQLQRGGFA
jgi:hypothetical protein